MKIISEIKKIEGENTTRYYIPIPKRYHKEADKFLLKSIFVDCEEID